MPIKCIGEHPILQKRNIKTIYISGHLVRQNKKDSNNFWYILYSGLKKIKTISEEFWLSVGPTKDFS